MAQIQFSTPYIIEGCDVPPRGAAKPLHDEMKMKAMKLIETTANRGNAAGQSLRTGEPDHPLLTRPFRAKPDLIADNLPLEGQVPRVPHLPRGPAASLNISEYHSVTPTNTYLFSKQEDSDQGGSSQIKAGTIFRVGPRHVPGSQLSRPIRAKPNQFVDNFPRSRRGAEPAPVPRASRDFLFLEIGHKKSQKVTKSHTTRSSVFFQNHVPKGPKRSQKAPKLKPPLVVSEMQPSAEKAHFVSACTAGAKHSQTITCNSFPHKTEPS
jgi:hypothetical protein